MPAVIFALVAICTALFGMSGKSLAKNDIVKEENRFLENEINTDNLVEMHMDWDFGEASQFDIDLFEYHNQVRANP